MLELNSLDKTLAERGKKYGEFKNHARITQRLKRVISQELDKRTIGSLSDSQEEALSMICHKIGRIINGDPNYIDSWVDIAGYAKLVADELQADEDFNTVNKAQDTAIDSIQRAVPRRDVKARQS